VSLCLFYVTTTLTILSLANQTGSSTKENKPPTIPAHENAEFEPEDWDDDLDGEGEPDTFWELEQETSSNQSSITLSSKTSSKRSISEAELAEENEDLGSPPQSPGPYLPNFQYRNASPHKLYSIEPKRPRVQ
jgi:hypothetical protein